MGDIKVPVECFSRVVGYFRPVNQWNLGMKAQFADRKMISTKSIMEAVSDKNIL